MSPENGITIVVLKTCQFSQIISDASNLLEELNFNTHHHHLVVKLIKFIANLIKHKWHLGTIFGMKSPASLSQPYDVLWQFCYRHKDIHSVKERVMKWRWEDKVLIKMTRHCKNRKDSNRVGNILENVSHLINFKNTKKI